MHITPPPSPPPYIFSTMRGHAWPRLTCIHAHLQAHLSFSLSLLELPLRPPCTRWVSADGCPQRQELREWSLRQSRHHHFRRCSGIVSKVPDVTTSSVDCPGQGSRVGVSSRVSTAGFTPSPGRCSWTRSTPEGAARHGGAARKVGSLGQLPGLRRSLLPPVPPSPSPEERRSCGEDEVWAWV